MAKVTKQVWLLQSESSAEYFASDCEPNPDSAFITVVAGPTTVEFDVPDVARCPHCHKALPEAEKPKLPLLPLVVGGVYRTRDGESVKIVEHCPHSIFPWFGDNARTYTDNGHQWKSHIGDNDLIERIA